MTVLPTLDVVIVSFNAREDLRACLASLATAPPRCPATIVVVDNASHDGSPDVVQEALPAALVVRLPENIGFAAANNVAMRQTAGDLILLLNSDTVVPPGALDTLVEELRARPDAAAIGPRLVDAVGRPELSHGRMLSPVNELRQKVLGRLWGRGPLGTWLARRLTGRERVVDWVSGACLLVRRADAEAVGLLDERYFMYTEDVDFCAALRARGRTIVFTPAATVVHKRGRSRQAAPEATRRAYRRSQLAFYAKHHPRWRPLLAWYLRLKGDA